MHKQKSGQQEKGMVAIMVAIFLTIIVSLLIVNYTRLVRREQRQALDRQLSTQAYYAAESGINDAEKVIENSPGTVPEKSSCATDGVYVTGNSNILSDSGDVEVSYSCLLVDTALPSVEYESVSRDASTVFQMHNTNIAQAIDNIRFSWAPTEDAGISSPNTSGCPASGSFPSNGSFITGSCQIGVLRIDVVPMSGLSRSDLINNAMTVIGIPGSGGGSVAGSSASTLASQGAIVSGNCNSSGCSVSVTGLSASSYIVRLKGVYADSKVTVTAFNGINQVDISGAQVLIDSTGKANDVLRRVQVRKPLGSSASFPDFALQTRETLCKRLLVPTSPSVAVQVDKTSLPAALNPVSGACDL